MYILMYIYIYMLVYIVCFYISTNIYICIYLYVYIIHTYILIYVYIYIYIHMSYWLFPSGYLDIRDCYCTGFILRHRSPPWHAAHACSSRDLCGLEAGQSHVYSGCMIAGSYAISHNCLMQCPIQYIIIIEYIYTYIYIYIYIYSIYIYMIFSMLVSQHYMIHI